MKKFVVSVGLAASGAVVLNMSGSAQSALFGDGKDWNASASLQGFYDSNYSVGSNQKGSYGIQFSPTVTATIPLTQTQIGFLYTYGLQWYQQRSQDNVNPYDQQHTVNLWVDHSFNENWDLKLADNFNVGQEPELLSGGGTLYRVNGNNIANLATATLKTDWTREFSTSLVYQNNLYNYTYSTPTVSDPVPFAWTLNRIDNAPELDLQWHLTPETMLFVGYQFLIENYTANEVIGYYYAGTPPNQHGPYPYYSDSRDNINHYGYLGVQMNLLPNLVAAARAGFQYYKTINDPLANTSDVSPYADLSLIYTYNPGCNAQIGFIENRTATDVVSVNTVNYSLTQDLQSSEVYASVNHQLTPKLILTVIGKFTDSQFNGGQYDNETQTDYGLGVSANYNFTRHFSGQAGYNYDDVSAPAGTYQSYTRNRVYVGFAVAY